MAEGGVDRSIDVNKRTVLVRGVPPDTSEQVLELYFEHTKFGENEVENIVRESPTEARVVFKNPEGKFVFL